MTDRYGRSVTYQAQTFATTNVPAFFPQSYQELVRVSQVVPSGTPAASAPDRWVYGYQGVSNAKAGNGGLTETVPFLHTISVPSPAGGATPSVATINYAPGTGFVTSVVDGNGVARTYNAVDGTHTQVVVTAPASQGGATVYSYTSQFNSDMSQVSRTDGAGRAIFTVLAFDPLDPYRPAMVQDGNGKTTTYTWDRYGNLTSATPPSSATRTPAATTYTYDYLRFALGELTQAQRGTQSPTTYAYFEPSGLLQNVIAPLPGTVGSTQTALTSYAYDALGNVLTVTRPGNNAATSITTTLGYTQDGGYSQPDAIGQPLTVADSLGHTTHLRYDAQGNVTSATDALSYRTDQTYTISNAPLATLLPATAQTGAGRGAARTPTRTPCLLPSLPLNGPPPHSSTGRCWAPHSTTRATSGPSARSPTPTGRRARPWACPAAPNPLPMPTTPCTA